MKNYILFAGALTISMVRAWKNIHDPTKCQGDYATIRSVNESLCCGSYAKGSQCSELYNDSD